MKVEMWDAIAVPGQRIVSLSLTMRDPLRGPDPVTFGCEIEAGAVLPIAYKLIEQAAKLDGAGVTNDQG